MNNSNINKVGIYIDGTFFLKINSYYRYHHQRKSTINFKGLFDLICYQISKQEEIDKKNVKVTDIHWFRGRYSTNQLEKKYIEDEFRYSQMNNERRIEDIFMYEGIIPHSYPLIVDNKSGEVEEKGIDVWLALETYEQAILKKLDYVVLIAGDTVYSTLIKKLTALNCKVIVLGWNISYKMQIQNNGQSYQVTTRTSQALIDESFMPIYVDTLINENLEEDKYYIQNLFNN